MTNGRRMSTDRFYGGIESRLEILLDLLSLLDEPDGENEGVSSERLINWILTNTNAEEQSAVERHLSFIESIGLIESDDGRYNLTRTGNCYLRDRDPLILYNCLRTGVKGFDTIVRALAIEPRTDDELMELLVDKFEECNMGTTAVAKRHREWLQAIGYVERVDGQNRLTNTGESVADQLRGVSSLDLELGSIYKRTELHSRYGGSIQGGIAPSNDEPVIFFFTGGTGEKHGYRDEILSDGTAIYTGEGQVGDMEMIRGNRVIRDHVEEGRELHFFSMEDAGVRHIGQYLYAGHFFEELPDANEEPREAIRFVLSPVGEVAPPHSNEKARPKDVETLEVDLNYENDPTVYQVPVKTGDGPIRTNFDRTIVEGVDRAQIEAVYDPPGDHDTLRVWGNQADEPAEEGDYLLFANRNGRHDGEYTHLARVAHATVLDDETAATFTDAVGWGEVTDRIFPHVMFLEPVYEADCDRASVWDMLGYGGWPNDTYSAINFDRRDGTFTEEYDSVRAFVEEIQGRQLYPEPTMPVYDTLEAACNDIRTELSQGGDGADGVTARIGEAVIEDWSRALDGFQPSDEVSPARAATFDQIRAVYESMEVDLETVAADLGTGTLQPFSAAQTLFLAVVRNAQDDLDVPGGPLNQPRLNSILHDSYTIDEPDGPEPPTEPSHPVVDHLRKGQPTVYKFTAPPDYWLTSVEYGSVSFEEGDRSRWENIEAGDVAILHSREEPSTDDFDTHSNGLIGVGILGETFEKDVPWWWDEHEGNKEFSMVVNFDRLFLTGDIDEIDITRGIAEKHRNDPAKIDRELAVLTENCLPIDEANAICADISQTAFPAQGMFARFRTDDDEIDYDRPIALIESMADSLTEVSTINAHKPFEGAFTNHEDDILEGLHFPDGQGHEILETIETALNAGKHVLLTGPPGTGKTEIAERVCEHLTDRHPYLFSDSEMTTATADWSTFDTVGGYMPTESDETDGDLSFTPGIVLNRLKNVRTGVQSNELTIIDELNRADIDKAFGQLFTLLSGQSVQLPYTVKGEEVELTTYEDVDGSAEPHQYVVPNSWRIFATMNAYDKTSLYEMSYAFMRRFAFVRVPAPEFPEGDSQEETLEVERIVKDYADEWGLSPDRNERMAVGNVWRKANHAVDERAIGPAIIEDVLRYVTHHEDEINRPLTQAVISYILPQLEGVPRRDTIVRKIADVDEIERNRLERAAQEMLQIQLSQNE
ncbi:AAA family ATPase [Halobacteria archaeon AArc-curdl1]|uniref:AAA family ATPase n=1 Tax=Natronosalvus hydrolyticus TaxID=2979988 RepID=A0AAP2Z5M7_9EURY|nr:AAA family ATPase [Halobacteria archaeon AArc-curdl1]